jgi:hypothetical protein
VAERRSHLGELERRLAETTGAVERKEIEAEIETSRGRIAERRRPSRRRSPAATLPLRSSTSRQKD